MFSRRPGPVEDHNHLVCDVHVFVRRSGNSALQKRVPDVINGFLSGNLKPEAGLLQEVQAILHIFPEYFLRTVRRVVRSVR